MSGAPEDVVIVGAGLAGATAAAVLGRQPLKVTLVDPRKVYPDCFKAEKIEADQADTLKRLGMFDVLGPLATPINDVQIVRDGQLLGTRRLKQHGMYYADMVNGVRRSIPTTVAYRQARVESIKTSDSLQQVVLDNGEVLTSRVVVLSCGIAASLAAQVGLRRQMVAKEFSIAFGFTIAGRNGQPFNFEAMTYYPGDPSSQIAFLTLFPIGNEMRANLFGFRNSNEDWVREFVRSPREQLNRALPNLEATIGDYEVVGKVQSGRIDLYRVEGQRQPGLVVIGDVGQSVCPTTGTGLSKVFTDVEALCMDCLPSWLATPGMGIEKIAQFYDHPRKKAVDHHSLSSALYDKHISMPDSAWWKARATCHNVMRSLYLRTMFRPPKKAVRPFASAPR